MENLSLGFPNHVRHNQLTATDILSKNVQIPGSKSSLSWLALLLILHNSTMKDQNFFHVHLVLFETDDQYFPTPPLHIQVHIDTPGHKNLPGRTQNQYFHSKDSMYFSH